MVVRAHAGQSTLWWWTGTGPPSPFPVTGLPGGVDAAAWSPVPPRLAVATAVGVYVVPSPHGRAVRLTLTPPAGGLAWSPDGARLAFSSADPGDPASLSVLNATSGEGVSYRSFAPGFQDAVGTPAWRPLA
jgi:Tol biopolymer transport system component